MDNLKDWTGNVFMCDAYAGLLDEENRRSCPMPERWLSYVLKNIKTTPKDKLYTLLPEFWKNEG